MHDFIAVGDTVTDAFIRLKDAQVNCDVSQEHCTITLSFGDKIPYESVEVVPAVGNSANASVAAARLGLSSALVTNLGDDDAGRTCLITLEKEKVDTEHVSIEPGAKSNYHYVLWYADDRTILVKHEKFTYKLPDINEPKWMYLSSLGPDTESYHERITEYLRAHPNIALAFQPGTFQISLGIEKLKDIYSRAKIIFCNAAEAERILNMTGLGVSELLKKLKELGPEIAVITDGPKGAYAYDGIEMFFQPAFPDPKPPFERTGAGDAFASTVVVALALAYDLPTALQWGAVNSMSVVQQVGAQKGLLTRPKIEEYLKSAPPEFKTKKLN
jgi:ribokinase